METRDLVLSRYPGAVLVEVPPISRAADSGVLQPGYWVVYEGRELSAAELGRGTTGPAAWTNAASKLQIEGARTAVTSDRAAALFTMHTHDPADGQCNEERRQQ